MVATKQLTAETSAKVKEALLRRHRHQHERRHNESKNRLPIIRSLADIGRGGSKSMFGSHSKSINYSVSFFALRFCYLPLVAPYPPGVSQYLMPLEMVTLWCLFPRRLVLALVF